MNGEFPFYESDPLMDELKAAAFEYLLLNPGSEFGDWQYGLISDYPTEVVDALGSQPEEVYAALSDLWESDYEDGATGACHSFNEWAEYFATDRSVELFYDLAEARREISRLEARLKSGQ